MTRDDRLQAAQQVLADRPTIRLAPDAARAFGAALARPARVNARLAAALARTATVAWLD